MSSTSKQLDFYFRARKQYQNSVKPFTYQLNIFSTQPKPKKFMIIINKFIDIMKQGMKQQYSSQQQLKQNYWNELQKFHNDTYEMMYIIENSYQKKKNKLRLYFGLLLHNKKIFKVITDIHQKDKLGYLYEKPQDKIKQLDQLFQPVIYLKDGQYQIMSEFVNQYEKYQEKKKQEEKIKQKLIQKQRKKQQQIERLKRIKQEEERKIKQQMERKENQEKQRIQKERKIKQQQQQQQQKKLKLLQKQKSIAQQIQFIPASYQAHYANIINTNSNINNQPANKLQVLPGEIKLPQIQPYKGKKHQKSSQILYQQKFKDQFQVFSFKLKPNFEQQNKQECFQCKYPLKQGFYSFGGNQNLCQYTGQYYCNQHISDQRISIPWKALQLFDLRGYTVSKKSFVQIKSYYQKPIIQIKNQDNIVKNSKILYQFLILKRQIHLMYDSICDLQLMQPLLKKKLNYCVKQNLFSLKNLYDIYNGHETPSLMRQYDILSKHFYRCERCQKRKGYICHKCKDPVRIFAFQLKQTHGCSNCRKMYHRKCLMGNKCDCNQYD